MKPRFLAALLVAAAAPALAASNEGIATRGPTPLFASQDRTPNLSPDIPPQLTDSQRVAYRAAFAAIRAGAWSDAAAALASAEPGPLDAVARAELYLAKDSPKVDLDRLVAQISLAPDLPQAVQLEALAKKRGGVFLPDLPVAHELVVMRGAPRRSGARSDAGDSAAAALAAQARPLLKGDQPAAAEALLAAASDQLGLDARTEWQQRVAWAYYVVGDDSSAWRLATMASGGSGDWTVRADWVAGLAAWRMKQCAAAGDSFARVAANAGDDEMKAAGLVWGARADMACGKPDRVQARLRAAARIPETFYGLLAARMLGLPAPPPPAGPAFSPTDWASLARDPNVVRAVALVEIGEYGLADALLRYQARIGASADHDALLHVAARLNLPATQIWLARNCPDGKRRDAAARYPAPAWTPAGGWRVDRSLVFAHALQESLFRTDAVSTAGARGLMQVMPTTADTISRRRGGLPVDRASLADPAVNMDYGQTYLEQLRDGSITGGLLPKVIAAYNAGPLPVQKWNALVRDEGDPLLYIESIPYYETRAYVTMVLRNYWVYEQQAGERPVSLEAMAQGMWPRFPGMPGASALRVDPPRRIASAN